MKNTKRQINALGLACPQPVVLTKKALDTFESELEVLVDNEIAVKNVMKLAQSRGFKASYVEQGVNEYCIQINGEGIGEKAKEEKKWINKVDSNVDSKVVVIHSDQMGSGTPMAGHTLMKNFTYALTQLDSLPETMVIYNSGVLITAEGSECLENLKILADAGMEILVCGDCLKVYEVLDKFAVGSITNMYTITGIMVGADSIIMP